MTSEFSSKNPRSKSVVTSFGIARDANLIYWRRALSFRFIIRGGGECVLR